MAKCLRCGAGPEWLKGDVPDDSVADAAFKRGVIAAAEYVSQFDSMSTHKFRLGDCVLSKFNIRKTHPRRNRSALTVSAKE